MGHFSKKYKDPPMIRIKIKQIYQLALKIHINLFCLEFCRVLNYEIH